MHVLYVHAFIQKVFCAWRHEKNLRSALQNAVGRVSQNRDLFRCGLVRIFFPSLKGFFGKFLSKFFPVLHDNLTRFQSRTHVENMAMKFFNNEASRITVMILSQNPISIQHVIQLPISIQHVIKLSKVWLYIHVCMLLLLRIVIQQSSFIQHRTPSSSNTRVHLHPTHSTAKYSPKLLTSWYVVLSFKLLYIRSSYWEECNTSILSPSFTGDIIRCWSLLSLWKQALYSEDILCGI